MWCGLFLLFALRSEAQRSGPDSSQRSGGRITYTFEGTASGAFQPESGAATTFADQPFTITAAAEAGDVVMLTQTCAVPSGVCKVWSLPVSAKISVAGVTATFLSPLAIFDNQTFSGLGLQRRAGPDFLDLQGNSAFTSYDLTGDLAPKEVFFKKARALGQFNCAHGCVMTNRGLLAVITVQNVRFTASRIHSGQ